MSFAPDKQRVSREEKVKRTNDVMGLIVDGLAPYEIRQTTAEMWGISARQTDRYRSWAATRLERMGNRDINEILYKIKTRYERQYRRAVASKDGRLAASILRDMVEFYGFKAAPKATVDEKGDVVEQKVEINFVSTEIAKKNLADRRKFYDAVEGNGEGT